MQANGVKIQTGWVRANSDDAFLVRDVNQNGIIDDGSELFGNATRLLDGTQAANGFEALKDLDANHNGVFTPDEDLSVQLWNDRNANGLSESGEVFPLDRANIVSIDLNYATISERDQFGNQTRQRALFQRTFEGQLFSRIIADIWFRAQ
jgi:hypothetical protein